MNANKTRKRTYALLQKNGSTLTVQARDLGNPTLKGFPDESNSEAPYRFRVDSKEPPNREAVYFLIGIPSEAKRDENNNPVDSVGRELTAEEYPMPELTRFEYLRECLPEGRDFIFNGRRFTVIREMPVTVSDVNLYVKFQCDAQ